MVLEVDDTASVTCNFALGSDALGCEVSFYASSMSDSMELLFAQNITREPSSNTVIEHAPLMGQLEGRAMNITVLTAELLADGSVSSIEIEAQIAGIFIFNVCAIITEHSSMFNNYFPVTPPSQSSTVQVVTTDITAYLNSGSYD